ncbi:MAG: hypothetical protein AAGD07_11095 [Planctomycetota bacterium]
MTIRGDQLRHMLLVDLQQDLGENAAPRPFHDRLGFARAALQQQGVAAEGWTKEELTQPVPMEAIASFADGTLPQDQSDRLAERAAVDGGLLAELIAAVRSSLEVEREDARDSGDASEWSGELNERVLAMVPGAEVAITNDREKLVDVALTSSPASTESRGRPPSPAQAVHSSRAGWWVAAALAASVLFATGWWMASSPGKPDRSGVDTRSQLAEETTQERPESATVPEVIPGDGPTEVQQRGVAPSIIVSNPKEDARPPDGSEGRPPTARDLAEDNTDAPPGSSRGIAETPERAMVQGLALENRSPPNSLVDDPVVSDEAEVQPLRVRWSKLAGVLLRRPLASVATGPASASIGSQGSSSISSGDPEMASVERGKETTLVGSWRWQTPPLCRAEGEIEGGGRIILSGDSVLRTDDDGALSIVQGSVAFADLPVDSRLRLALPPKNFAAANADFSQRVGEKLLVSELEVTERTTMTVGRDWVGATLSLHRGQIRALASVAPTTFAAGDMQFTEAGIQPLGTVTRRQPAWVDRPIDKIVMARSVLGQMQRSDDVGAELRRQLTAMQRRVDAGGATKEQISTLATLATWRVATSEQSLFRIVGSDSAALRLAALNRIAMIPPRDPRHALMWRGLQQITQNAATTRSIHTGFQSIWNNEAPTATSQTGLVGLLTAPTLATRAAADYLLRRFHGGGPIFDPTWTGRNQTRGAALWRSWLSGRMPNQRATSAVPNNATP